MSVYVYTSCGRMHVSVYLCTLCGCMHVSVYVYIMWVYARECICVHHVGVCT